MRKIGIRRGKQRLLFAAVVAAIAMIAAGPSALASSDLQCEPQDSVATALDFRELLYLTAVYAGVPKAIEATRVFTQIVAEREVQSPDRATRVDLRD
jgi:hypothetical protein